MLEIFAEYLNLDESDDLYRAASYVLSQNLVHGDALTMRTYDSSLITFAEWGYLGKGKFQRHDFPLDFLTRSSTFSAENPQFAHLGKHEIFTPTKTDPPMTVRDLALLIAMLRRRRTLYECSSCFALRGHNPDVLTCIADLSNDEVFTPLEFANRMPDKVAEAEEAWAGKPRAGFCKREAHNDVRLNLVTLSKLEGERNGEYKASLNIGGVFPTRQIEPISKYHVCKGFLLAYNASPKLACL